MIGVLPIVIVVVAAVIGIGAAIITKTDDGPIEQAAEEVIDYELGLPPGAIDLTKPAKKK